MLFQTKQASLEKWFFLILIFGVLFVFWKIIEPFILVMITALAAAVIFSPLHKKLTKKIQRPALSAVLLSLLLLLLVIVPLFILLFVIVKQAGDLVSLLNTPGFVDQLDITLSPYFTALPELLQQQIATIDLAELSKFVADWIISNVGQVFSSTARMALDLFIFFIAFYYILTSDEQLHELVLELSPLRDSVDRKIISSVAQTVRSVVFGSLFVALLQGVVATIGMIILNLPGAVVWGTLTTIFAPIPIVGTAIVMLPATIYFFIVGKIGAGFVMLALIGAVGMIYNLLAPRLIQRKTSMHAFLILISLLGGLNLFGPIGFIVGPSVLAILIVLVELYRKGVLKS